MVRIPLFVNGKGYFHQTNEERPPTFFSTNPTSIWYTPATNGSNGSHIAVSCNGGDVCLYLFCGICSQWRMPSEGGHTRSHHQSFLVGHVCLPMFHTSRIIHAMICNYYGIPLGLEPENWFTNHHSNTPGVPQMIEINQVVVDKDIMLHNNAANVVEDEALLQLPPPHAPAHMNPNFGDKNNVARSASGRPLCNGTGVIDRFSFPPSQPRKHTRRALADLQDINGPPQDNDGNNDYNAM